MLSEVAVFFWYTLCLLLKGRAGGPATPARDTAPLAARREQAYPDRARHLGRLLAADDRPLDIETEADNGCLDRGRRGSRARRGPGLRGSARHPCLVNATPRDPV